MTQFCLRNEHSRCNHFKSWVSRILPKTWLEECSGSGTLDNLYSHVQAPQLQQLQAEEKYTTLKSYRRQKEMQSLEYFDAVVYRSVGARSFQSFLTRKEHRFRWTVPQFSGTLGENTILRQRKQRRVLQTVRYQSNLQHSTPLVRWDSIESRWRSPILTLITLLSI